MTKAERTKAKHGHDRPRRIYTLDPDLSEEQVAVTFAMTSRSPEPFDQIATQVSETRAAEFHERWVTGYGHASVAEHAILHIAVEDVSRLCADNIESNRLASYTEKSSRYQVIGNRDYHVPPEVRENAAIELKYHTVMRALFDAYDEATKAMCNQLENTRQQGSDESDRAFRLRVRREVTDSSRCLLPAATLTNLGMSANARTMAHAITKLLSDPLEECRATGQDIKAAAAGMCPTLVKYADYNDQVAAQRAVPRARRNYTVGAPYATVKAWDSDAACRIAQALDFADPQGNARNENQAAAYIAALLDGRREHDPMPRALEVAHYQAQLIMDYGALREFRRHRMLTTISQPLRVTDGYEAPPLFDECGLTELLQEAIAKAEELYWDLHGHNPATSQYAVTHAHRQRLLIDFNLREIAELFRLRTSDRAHRSIRIPCLALSEQMRELQPELMAAVLGPADA